MCSPVPLKQDPVLPELGQLKDNNYVFTSKPYTILSDQLHHLNAEIERYKGLVEVLQNDKNQFLQREKEMCAKGESVDEIKQSITAYEAKIEELEHQILKSMAEKNDLEIKVEGSLQDSGKKDFKDEIHVMAAAFSKEMEMMENQLNRSKDAASEALALREEAESLRTLLAKKISEQKEISDRYNAQVSEIKSLKALMKNQPGTKGAHSTDRAPLTGLTNTGDNQRRPEQKQHNGQRWYAQMSVDKKAEYLERCRLAGQQKTLAHHTG